MANLVSGESLGYPDGGIRSISQFKGGKTYRLARNILRQKPTRWRRTCGCQSTATTSRRTEALVEYKTKRTYLPGKYNSRESVKAYEAFCDEIRAGVDILVADTLRVPVGMLFAEYQRHLVKRFGPEGTEVRQFGTLVSRMAQFLSMDVTSFSATELLAVQQIMVDLGNRRSHINPQIRRLIRAFKWGIPRNFVTAEQVYGLECVEPLKKGEAAEPTKIMPVDWADVEATLPFLSPVVADMVRLQWLTGARQGEIWSMRSVEIDRTTEPWVYRPATHKTKHRGFIREIRLGPAHQELLLPYIFNDFLFTENGKPLSTKRYRDRIENGLRKLARSKGAKGRERKGTTLKAWLAQHGVNHWHPHQIRHTFATMVANTYDLRTAQTVLGHKTIKTTERYAELDPSAANKVAMNVALEQVRAS